MRDKKGDKNGDENGHKNGVRVHFWSMITCALAQPVAPKCTLTPFLFFFEA